MFFLQRCLFLFLFFFINFFLVLKLKSRATEVITRDAVILNMKVILLAQVLRYFRMSPALKFQPEVFGLLLSWLWNKDMSLKFPSNEICRQAMPVLKTEMPILFVRSGTSSFLPGVREKDIVS